MTEWAVLEGVVAAAVICLSGGLISLRVSRKIDASLAQSGRGLRFAGLYGGLVARMMISLMGVVGVYVCFGRSWAVPCALAMVPFYFAEVVCSSLLLARQGSVDSESKNEWRT